MEPEIKAWRAARRGKGVRSCSPNGRQNTILGWSRQATLPNFRERNAALGRESALPGPGRSPRGGARTSGFKRPVVGPSTGLRAGRGLRSSGGVAAGGGRPGRPGLTGVLPDEDRFRRLHDRAPRPLGRGDPRLRPGASASTASNSWSPPPRPDLDPARLARDPPAGHGPGLALEVGLPSPNPARRSRHRGPVDRPAEHARDLIRHVEAVAVLGMPPRSRLPRRPPRPIPDRLRWRRTDWTPRPTS